MPKLNELTAANNPASILPLSNGGTGIYNAPVPATLYDVNLLSVSGVYTLGNSGVNSQLVRQYTYSAVAPSTITQEGPWFYTIADPSDSNDNHTGSYNGVSGTAFSDNGTVLKQLVGGRFVAIRKGASGSTNLLQGVQGTAVLGDTASGVSIGDGGVGGLFTAYVKSWGLSGAADYDPFGVGGAGTGVVGKAIANNSYSLPTANLVGVFGLAQVETTASDIYGGLFAAESQSHTLALAGNAYGVYVRDIVGAKNLSMALRTGLGAVQLGDDVTIAGGIRGNLTISALNAPTVTSVHGGANGQYSFTDTGSKTYTYKVVAVYASGETSAASFAVSTTKGFDDLSVSEHNNIITWTPVVGAVGGYDIYRTAAGGTTTNTTGKIANVPQNVVPSIGGNCLTPTTPSYADVGAAGDSAVPPSANSTGMFRMTPRAFSTLPAASVFEGMMANVNDSATATWGATVTGGGSNHVLVRSNGTNWTVVGA